jgi:hypothetical protein
MDESNGRPGCILEALFRAGSVVESLGRFLLWIVLASIGGFLSTLVVYSPFKTVAFLFGFFGVLAGLMWYTNRR